MIRTITAAVLTSAALLAASGASAGTYVATPAVASAKATMMTRDTAWNQRDGAFYAVNAPMRGMAACQLAARDLGQLSAFTADGQAFDAAAMEQCNAKAKVAKTSVAKAGATPASAN